MTVNRSDFQGKPQRSSVDDDALGVFWDPTDPQGEPFVAPKSAFGGSGSGGADAKGVVVHGATAGTARPSGYASVEWIGSVEPTNAIDGDTWIDTTT